MKVGSAFLLLLVLNVFCAPVWADAARISAGGTVHQLRGGGTVSMVSETVRIKISEHLQEVDCTFNFENAGPPCSVRIGFPDFTNLTDLTSEETASNPKASFLTYAAYVNGCETKSELVPSDHDSGTFDNIQLWHASDVQFPANSMVTFRACYSQLPDISPTTLENLRRLMKVTKYILQTAASWQGPVKQADVYVAFDKDVVPAPIELVSVQELMNSKDKSARDWWRRATIHTVAYSSSVRPSIDGQELHFTLKDFRPTENDDLLLIYQPMNRHQARTFLRYAESILAKHKPETVYVPSDWIFPKRQSNKKPK